MKPIRLSSARADFQDREKRADALRGRFSRVTRAIDRRAALLRARAFAVKLAVGLIAFCITGTLGWWLAF